MRALILGVLLVGCTAAAPVMDGEMAVAPPELGSALNVTVAGDSVRLELHITNVSGGPLTLEFATAQRYDFEVEEAAGGLAWRWSDEMMFAQVLGEERLEAGESRRYTAGWSAPGGSGDYVARGRLTSTNYPVDLRTQFRLPVE
jgi:hypothetical protein